MKLMKEGPWIQIPKVELDSDQQLSFYLKLTKERLAVAKEIISSGGAVC